MSFLVLTSGSEFNASHLMDNFRYVREGHLLPLGGTDLRPTTGVYDIGDATYTFQSVSCIDLYLNGVSDFLSDLLSGAGASGTAIKMKTPSDIGGGDRPVMGWYNDKDGLDYLGTGDPKTVYVNELYKKSVLSTITTYTSYFTVSFPATRRNVSKLTMQYDYSSTRTYFSNRNGPVPTYNLTYTYGVSASVSIVYESLPTTTALFISGVEFGGSHA